MFLAFVDFQDPRWR